MLNAPQKNEFTENLEHRTIVVDTSTLLVAGTALLGSLPACRVVIPSIVVKELEAKRSHPTLGFLAREWLHLLEELRQLHGRAVQEGVPHPLLPEITVSVEPNHSTQANLPKHLRDGSHDSTILAVALNLKLDGVSENVIILSNDTPLRLHATLDLNLDATEYNSMIATGAKPFSGFVDLPVEDEAYATLIEEGQVEAGLAALARERGSDTSHYALRVTVGEHAPATHYLVERGCRRAAPLVGKKNLGSVSTRTVEQHVAAHYLLTPPEELPVVSVSGSAGTGKTLLSVAAGLQELAAGEYQKVMVFRSLHEMGKGQELGFLPGTVEEKMEAWAGAIYDAVDVIAYQNLLRRDRALVPNAQLKQEVAHLRSLVEVAPISYLRGRSLSNSFIILDEAQNFSRNELLNILSRAGEGTKMVLLWDPSQVDNKFLQTGTKSDVWSIVEDFRREEIFAHVSLRTTERSRLAEVAAKLLEG